MSPFEVFYPYSQSIRDVYSPLFALFRYQYVQQKGVLSQSALWGLVRETKTAVVGDEPVYVEPHFKRHPTVRRFRPKRRYFPQAPSEVYTTHLVVGPILEQITGPERAKIEFFKGLFGYDRQGEEETVTLFWVDL